MRLLVLALGLAVAGQAAHADDRREQAKHDVDAALAAQAAGNYDEAIALYKTAYLAVPHPEILFDLGQAYRLKGDLEAAADYYTRYLSAEPNGRLSKDAARWVGEIEKQLAARKAEPQKRPAVDVPKKPPQPPPVAATVTATPSPPTTRGPRITPWVLSGAALVAGGAAIGFDLWSRSTYDASLKEPDPDRQLSLWHSANTKLYVADGLAIASVGCAAFAVWSFLRGGDKPAIQPTAGVAQVGITWATIW